MPDGYNAEADAIRAVGREFESLSEALGKASKYAGQNDMTAQHFGGVPSAVDAGPKVLDLVSQLARSIGYVAAFATEAVGALKATVASYEQGEADAKQQMAKAEGGK